MNYFKAKSPIMTGEENRISFVHKDDKSPVTCAGTGHIQVLKMLLVAPAVMTHFVLKYVI